MPNKDENRFIKQKNLLDLEHQKYLNYLNILLISLVTANVTIIWGWIAIEFRYEGIVYTALTILWIVISILIYFVQKKRNAILRKLRVLRLS